MADTFQKRKRHHLAAFPRRHRADLRVWSDTRIRPSRTRQFIVALYDSEVEGLKHISDHANRTPGEQMRAILWAAIRHHRNAPNWTPPELDTE